MSSMELKIYGDRILREKSGKVDLFDDWLVSFFDDMVETMAAESGVGLAATQVGVLKRIAVVNPVPDDSGKLLKLVNPKIVSVSEETGSFEEGCLSVPGIRGNVIRPVAITLEYQDEKGEKHVLEGDGLVARIVQHEIDHLDGVLFVDRLSFAKKAMIRGKLRELARGGRQE